MSYLPELIEMRYQGWLLGAQLEKAFEAFQADPVNNDPAPLMGKFKTAVIEFKKAAQNAKESTGESVSDWDFKGRAFISIKTDATGYAGIEVTVGRGDNEQVILVNSLSPVEDWREVCCRALVNGAVMSSSCDHFVMDNDGYEWGEDPVLGSVIVRAESNEDEAQRLLSEYDGALNLCS